MRPFQYHRADSVAHAAALFAGADDARYVSGGQTLIPTMKQRLATPSDLIDIARVPELRGISTATQAVSIGGAATHAEIAAAEGVVDAIPALAGLASRIGDPAVRARGTLGGSLANNDPAADYPAAMLALGAVVRTERRAIPAERFFTGLFSTALEDGEIITGIDVPVPSKAAYCKFPSPASRYAMAGAFVAVMVDGSIRVAITGAGAGGVFRATAIEEALARSWDAASVEAVALDPAGMLSDVHGSAAYRAHLVTVMAKRAVDAAG